AHGEAIDPHLVSREQGAHGELVARRDLLDQGLVGQGRCDHGKLSHYSEPERTRLVLDGVTLTAACFAAISRQGLFCIVGIVRSACQKPVPAGAALGSRYKRYKFGVLRNTHDTKGRQEYRLGVQSMPTRAPPPVPSTRRAAAPKLSSKP